MLNKEFEYYKDHLPELYKKYPNRYVVLKDQEVKFDGETFEDALDLAIGNNLKLGTFLIQVCGKDRSCYTATFTRPIFA
jgi:hypothetical protein